MSNCFLYSQGITALWCELWCCFGASLAIAESVEAKIAISE